MRNGTKKLQSADYPIAVVLGAGITSLGVIRSLGRRGITVYVGGNQDDYIGLHSRYALRFILPDAGRSEREFIDILMSTGNRIEEKGVLIPTSDSDVLFVSRSRKELSKSYHIGMPEENIIESIINKASFSNKMLELGFEAPKTYHISDSDKAQELSNVLDYPCLLKPSYSQSFGQDFGRKCVEARNKLEFLSAFSLAQSRGHEMIAQEIIPGEDTRVFGFCSYFNNAGVPLGIFTYRKIRGYPDKYGLCSLVESIDDANLTEIGIEVARSLKYFGISEIEFKLDPRDDRFKVIEMNARTWAQNALADACGSDLTYLAYADATGMDIPLFAPPKTGVKWWHFVLDSRLFVERFRNGSYNPGEWIRSLKGVKSYPVFASDDIAPFVNYPIIIARELLRPRSSDLLRKEMSSLKE